MHTGWECRNLSSLAFFQPNRLSQKKPLASNMTHSGYRQKNNYCWTRTLGGIQDRNIRTRMQKALLKIMYILQILHKKVRKLSLTASRNVKPALGARFVVRRVPLGQMR